MNKIIFFLHICTKVNRTHLFGVLLAVWLDLCCAACTREGESRRYVVADILILDRKGYEKRLHRLEDPKLLQRLTRLTLSEKANVLCPVDKLIRLTDDEGRVLTLPLSLCPQMEHVYTWREGRWGRWRIDPRVLPLLDSLYASNP
ncbi:MAG: hypothetical protein N2050_08385 [Flavobacteriales bacterium]|nr:hypothetical protein [Flavobacteriales bacterium]MCX7650552.1 hypothetical protein [Flavobacteriales bacterium]MDW8431760.1 hypothetical protein [Flavobacteriales bacterium]